MSKLFEDMSSDIWLRLKDTSKAHIRMGKETITDNTLLKILRSKSKNIKVFQTPKLHEKEKGSDWEWWIGTKELGWIRYAIQAKKLDPFSENYKSLNYKPANKKPKDDLKDGPQDDPEEKTQAQILKEYATANNSIPLYSFYNYLEVDVESKLHKYWHQDLSEFRIDQFGWTFTPVENVIEVLELKKRGYRKFHNIHQFENTHPMSYLVKALNIVEKLKLGKTGEKQVIGYSDSLPDYFKEMELTLDDQSSQKTEPSTSLMEYNVKNKYFIDPAETVKVKQKHPSIAFKEYYDEKLALYPSRVLKIDILDFD